jgi:hypothetical protein
MVLSQSEPSGMFSLPYACHICIIKAEDRMNTTTSSTLVFKLRHSCERQHVYTISVCHLCFHHSLPICKQEALYSLHLVGIWLLYLLICHPPPPFLSSTSPTPHFTHPSLFRVQIRLFQHRSKNSLFIGWWPAWWIRETDLRC